jgi:hypothetical protein
MRRHRRLGTRLATCRKERREDRGGDEAPASDSDSTCHGKSRDLNNAPHRQNKQRAGNIISPFRLDGPPITTGV